MVGFVRMFNREDYTQLLEFYKRIDYQYYPRLSDRRGGLEAHILKNLNNKGGFFLFIDNGLIEGACGYLPLDESKKIVEFNLFSFTEKYWKTLMPFNLVRYMIKMKDQLGYSDIDKFIARTFYKESAERMERIGFKKVAEIENDLVEGRTSYYYVSDAKVVIAKFQPTLLNQKN